MKVEKELKNLGIQPIDSISIEEKDALIRAFSKMLFNTFPNVSCNYEEVAMRLYYCNMQRASYNREISSVNYFYKNKNIYFEQNLPITVHNENIIHECIHAIQDVRDEQGNLNKIGLCEFDEFKIKGMAFNECVVDWITSIMLNKEEKNLYLYHLLKQITYIAR